jgi:hypothetical protein
MFQQAEAFCSRDRASLRAARWARCASAINAAAEAVASGDFVSGRRGFELAAAAAARRRRTSVMVALGGGAMSIAATTASAASGGQE